MIYLIETHPEMAIFCVIVGVFLGLYEITRKGKSMKTRQILTFIIGTAGYTFLSTVDYKITIGVLLIMIANILY